MFGIKHDEEDAESVAPASNAADPFDGEEYVRWAYRLLLGREPECPATIENNPFKNDRHRLVQFILNSAEFKNANSIIPSSEDGTIQITTDNDIFYCFRLLLGRNPHPEEWPGHSSRAGQELAGVVSSYITSREFAARGMLNKTYTDAIDVVKLKGFSILVSSEDLAVGSTVRQGAYEPHVTAVFKRYIRPGMCVVDIGANIGYFTMLSATLVGPAGFVIAVEPNPDNVKLIEASRRVNGFHNVTIVAAAAGRKTGILALNVSHTNGITGEMFSEVGQILGSRPVPCFALDAIVPRDVRPDFVKIDVEGAELNALTGFSAALERSRPIIVSEFGPGGLPGISGCSGPDYLHFLINKGYDISVIESDGSETSFGAHVEGVMDAFKRVGADHVDILARQAATAY